MKKNLLYILFSATLMSSSLTGCDGWLGDTEPTDFLNEQQVWNDNTMVLGILANLYNDVPNNGSLDNDVNFSLFDDFMWCGLMNNDVETARNRMTAYAYDIFRYYSGSDNAQKAYEYLYKINQGIESLKNSTLPASEVAVFDGELRFLRAYAYFQMCIRMGGVPLITGTQVYTSGMDIATLQIARSSEAEIYNFVYNECMAVKDALAANNTTVNMARANEYAALALACRAMLYAGSIAKYNAAMPSPVVSELQAGVVGMTGEDPKPYYEKALSAAETLISARGALQGIDNPSADAFYKAVCIKDGNTEVLWSKDYSASKFHTFSFANIAQSMNEDNDNGSDLCPTLQLVEAYQKLDGTSQKLADKDAGGNYIAYAKRSDIFTGRDHRLAGTCLLPEQTFKGAPLDIQAGVAVYQDGDYTFVEGTEANSTYEAANDHPQADGGKFVGKDGPLSRATYTNTGFNLRKYVDETAGSSARGQGSYIWWAYFRMGEVYLNAAEAAMELGQTDKALRYANAVRERAGFGKNSWTAADLSIDNLLNERRCELALEDHRWWDLKRLRKAHNLWNGVQSENTMLYALYPYRVIGGPDDGKYIFVRKVAPRFQAPRNFRIGNYYTSFSTDDLNKNPKLVQNPNL